MTVTNARMNGSHARKSLAARPRFEDGMDTTSTDESTIHLEMSSCRSNNLSGLWTSRLAQARRSNKTNSQRKLRSQSSQMISLKITRGGSLLELVLKHFTYFYLLFTYFTYIYLFCL